MKTRTSLALAFFMFFILHANSQNVENPFAKFGYNVLMATSSKGEFVEFHDQKDIVEIGSVLYNTKERKIVKILDKDETIIDISSATAAMSIDPLCERYYWISPYVYAMNNPLRFVDPDGRLARDSIGNIIYNVTDRVDTDNNTSYTRSSNGEVVTLNYQYVTVYADDGTPIEVQQVTGAMYTDKDGNSVNVMGNSKLQKSLGIDVMSNCHGLAFGDGKFIMGQEAVSSILKGDGYTKAQDFLDADVGLVQPSISAMKGEKNWYHSARVDGLGTFRDKNDITAIRRGVPYHELKNFNGRGNSQVTSYYKKR